MAESLKYCHYIRYFSTNNVQYNTIMCEELDMLGIPCLAHILNFAVLVVLKTDSVAILVIRIRKVAHFLHKILESIVTPI